MFESQCYSRLREAVATAAAGRAETGLATGTQVCDALRDVQAAQDMLDGIQADLLARLDDTAGYETEGASSTSGWARRELRLSPARAKQRRKAGRTLHVLPDVADSLASGRMRLDHVHEFTAGITKVGADVMVDAQHILVPVAETADPTTLRAAIAALDEVVHPEKLDDEYAKDMDRRDLKTAKCGTGWHVSGFLDQETGTRFHQWLTNASTPETEGDTRAPSERRVEAFGRLLDPDTDAAANNETSEPAGDTTDNDPHPATNGTDTGADADPADSAGHQTGHGEPEGDEPGSEQDEDNAARQQPTTGPTRARRRARPTAQLLVLADLDTLMQMPGAEPATLAGFGPIGTELLGYLTCISETTGLLTDGLTTGPTPQARVLNVGRASRLATRAQKHAIRARQDGVCANPGCHLTHLEYHHVAWWNRDHGRSDLDNLIGLCNRCHHLVHNEKLVIRPDGDGGFTFHRTTGRRINDHTRNNKRRVRDALTHLRRTAAITEDKQPHRPPARPVRERPRQPDTHTRRRQWIAHADTRHRSIGEHHVYEYINHHRPTRT